MPSELPMTINEPLTNIEASFTKVAVKEVARLSKWFYKTPMIVNMERYQELHHLQELLHRSIYFFVEHYAEYESLLPLNPRARRIVEIANEYPYRVGTYRPDFVISNSGEIRICEINARFPLNGYFVSGFSELIANRLLIELGVNEPQHQIQDFFQKLLAYFGRIQRVCALKSPADKAIDMRYYSQIFQDAGIAFIPLSTEEIVSNLDLLDGAAVVNEINQMDLEDLDTAVIEKIAASNSLNDLRTIFLIHDKRFLSVLSNRDFLSAFLDLDDLNFLSEHIIPTYTRAQRLDLWEQARGNKEQWLIKPYLLGKSQDLLAGCVTELEHWNALFGSEEIEKMVLQPFICQKQFRAELDGYIYQDYVVGTLLCFDDRFLGPGICRASSFPVTNQGDDRKVSVFVTPNVSIQTDFIL
jgi:hypothetical protein